MFIPAKIYVGVAHHLTTTGGANVTTSYWVKICIFYLVYKTMDEFEWYQGDLLKWTERNLKKIEKWQKNNCERAAFLEVLETAIIFA